MYDFIRGTVAAIRENTITLENNGIGYRLYITALDKDQIKLQEERFFYISFVMREDGIWLYGFLEEETLDVFEMLTTVSTIGPKNAMTILSTCPVEDLSMAVHTEDTEFLVTIPGIGKKTAGRLILELADKLDAYVSVKTKPVPEKRENDNAAIALEALQNLGFVRRDVEEILHAMNLGQMTIEEIIKESLRQLS
ncbi:MAG: Holliday junction branch migration protein RuvA [Tissierellia bacterium]|jgi:Holliday junction DNA helicase RuvA|nr:Holliday junction branch migration protein RuvA [Bacillota bacterium]NLK58167.1 Holliday junction branch migration protein RuvA [Tissierellia bacterium]